MVLSKCEETLVKDYEQSGHHSTDHTVENVEPFFVIVNEDECGIDSEITGELGISYRICLHILREDLDLL